MFNKNTLIIVGAGASKEAKVPTGNELKQNIANSLDIRFAHGVQQISGHPYIYNALREAIKRNGASASDIELYLRTAWRIRDAMPQAISIDHFIDAHQGDQKLELCGKLAIVQSILQAERNSSLFFEIEEGSRTLDYRSLEETWFNRFMQLLTENCRVNQLEQRLSTIAFIVFNYDRCIEHFLYHSLQTYYGISPNEAASLVKRIAIYHPYGTVGALPWYQERHQIDFGTEPDPRRLLDLASQIKTFTEGTDPNSSDVTDIRNRVAKSQIVIFLGFAFHRQNLDLIKPRTKHLNREDVRYFATAKGISKSDCEIISTDLVKLAGVRRNHVSLQNELTCYELFKEYWRSLSLG